MYLVGQEKNKKLIDNGKLDNANFIIIKGPTNYGKTYLAKYIANHFNLTYVALDNKVATIRELVSISNKNNECLYHFKDFEKSSPAAKASLLKIAEETPKGIKIVVTTSSYNLLDTLMSRAYILNIEPYSEEDIIDYNKNLSFNIELFDILQKELRMKLTPSKLFKLKNIENIKEIIDLAVDSIAKIKNGLKLEDISQISNNFWKDDGTNTDIFLQLLESGLAGFNFKCIAQIEKAKYTLAKVSISNYRQLIHNMLMEMV